MKKGFLSLVISISMLLSTSTVAFAQDTKEIALPSTSSIYETERNPIGELSPSEVLNFQGTNQICKTCPAPRHFSSVGHSHEITQITSQYRGEVNRGIVAETTRRVNTSAVLSYEKSLGVSNSYSVSIGFEKNVVSGQLGYDVNYSTSSTASYAVDVPANKMASITLYDKYDVTKFNVKTTFVYNTTPIVYTYEYGDGWAQKWTNFGFSGKVW